MLGLAARLAVVQAARTELLQQVVAEEHLQVQLAAQGLLVKSS